MSEHVRPVGDPSWRDADGSPITVGCCVEQIGVDAELGALRSRLGQRGRVLRRSATRLVVRFEGETTLARIRPALVRVIPEDAVPDSTGTGTAPVSPPELKRTP